MSGEGGKIFGNTPTNILYSWYFSIYSHIFSYYLFIHLWAGEFKQSAFKSNECNTLLLKSTSTRLHEDLKIILKIIVRFNIPFLKIKFKAYSEYWSCSKVYSRFHIGVINEVMELVRKKETYIFGPKWKLKRELLTQINVHSLRQFKREAKPPNIVTFIQNGLKLFVC